LTIFSSLVILFSPQQEGLTGAIKCPKFHFENPEDTLFCGKCGTQFLSPEEVKVTETPKAPDSCFELEQ